MVTALRDERGLKLTPVEALQRELEEVRVWGRGVAGAPGVWAGVHLRACLRACCCMLSCVATVAHHGCAGVLAAGGAGVCGPAQVASSRAELLALLRNMALGLMPEVLRVPGGAPPAAHEFLIRGCALSKAGFMVVGDSVRVGQRVRFMVRRRRAVQGLVAGLLRARRPTCTALQPATMPRLAHTCPCRPHTPPHATVCRSATARVRSRT